MLNELYNKIKEDKAFRDLFQPASKEELEKRQKERIVRVLKEGQCTLNPDGTYSCEGSVSFYDLNLTKLPVRFKEVKGFFDCGENELTSLEGSPREVGEGFNCSYNNLTSLEGSPEKVKGDFYCDNNHLTSLEGAPEVVGGYFDCSGNKLLTSLEGSPEKIGGLLFIGGTPIANVLGVDLIKGSEVYKYVK